MSEPAFYIEHGKRSLMIEPEKLVSRHREPDSMPLVFQDPDKTKYRPGTEIAAYPGMPIVERERTQDGPVWLFRLLLEGIEDPSVWFIETDLAESTPEEGWDEVRRTVFTRQPKHEWFAKGVQLIDGYTGLPVEGYEYLWCMDRSERKHRAAGYHAVDMAFKGLRGDKPFKRRITTTPQVVAPGKFTGLTIYTAESWVGFPPKPGPGAGLSGSDLTIEYDIPQVSVTDTFITSTPPPTDKFPGFWSPEDPPLVFILPVFAAEYTWHIPFGWMVTNLQSEQLAGQKLWLLSLTWGNQVPTTPMQSTVEEP